MRVLALVTTVTFVFIALTVSDCSSGENSWDYDGTSKTITFYGDIPDFDTGDIRPWEPRLSEAENVVISEGVGIIGNRAFEGSDSIQNILLPSTLKTVGDYAFASCSALKSVTLPESIEYIGTKAFSDCRYLATVMVLGSPLTVGEGVFDDSSSLTDGFSLLYLSSVVPDGMFSPSVGSEVWIYSSDLTSVTDVGKDSFRNASMKSVEFSMKLESLGEEAFAGSSLTSVLIPGPTSISARAFSGCLSLTKANIPSVNTIPESAFSGCTALSELNCSVNLSSVSDYAFHSTAIKEIVFPNSLSSLGTEAFSNCGYLEHVAFTGNAYHIGDRAFAGCENLKTVEIQSVYSSGTDVFLNCASIERAYVSEGTYQLPQTARVYSHFESGTDVLIRYDFGTAGGSCVLFSDTEMDTSLIKGGHGRQFLYWEDGSGNKVTDMTQISSSTALKAIWSGDLDKEKENVPAIILCAVAVLVATITVIAAVRR